MNHSLALILALLLIQCSERRHKITRSPDISTVHTKDSVNWKSLGPFGAPLPLGLYSTMSQSGSGSFMCVSVNPDNAKDILIGHATAGIFRTTDGGISYTQTMHLGFASGVYKIERFPDNPKHLIATTAIMLDNDLQYGYGLIESLDGGASWFRNSLKVEPTLEVQEPFMDVVITDPKKSKSLVSISKHKVYLSNNAGASWQMSFESRYNLKHIVVSVDDPQTLIICGNGILLSTDGGYTFNDLTNDVSSVFGLIPNEESLFHAAFSIQHPGMVYFVSQNQKVNIISAYLNELDEPRWLDYNQVPLSNSHLTFNVQMEDGIETLWLGTSKLFKSKPVGKGLGHEGPTFARIGSSLSGDKNFLNEGINSVTVDAKGQVWVCTNGGVNVYKASHEEIKSSGKLSYNVTIPPSLYSITSKTLNLNASYLYGFDRSSNNTIVAGAGSNGLFVYQNGKWLSSAIDGFADRVVALGDSLKFAALLSNKNFITTDNGLTYKYAHAGSEQLRAQLSYHSKTGLFFIANNQLYRKQASGYFELLSSGISSEHKQISAFCVDPINEKDIWLAYHNPTAKSEKVLWHTDDGGLTWKDHSAMLPVLKNASVSSICKNKRTEIAISFKQLDKKDELNKVYISYDGGRIFHNQSKGLPNLPVLCLLNASGRWICGTANGVYIFDQKQWKLLGKNLPEVGVSEMKYQSSDKMLLVSTTGRGLWAISLK